MSHWSVKRVAGFEADLRDLRKALYGKNARDWAEYTGLVESLCEALAVNPYAGEYSSPHARVFPRAYPKGYSLDGCLLAYAKFKMPGQSGAARHGRIAFEVNEPLALVYLLAAYTHATPGHGSDWPNSAAIARLKQGRLPFEPR